MDRLVEPVAAGVADYVKGDRLGHPDVRQRMPRSVLGCAMLTRATRWASDTEIRDSQCGYTLCRRMQVCPQTSLATVRISTICSLGSGQRIPCGGSARHSIYATETSGIDPHDRPHRSTSSPERMSGTCCVGRDIMSRAGR